MLGAFRVYGILYGVSPLFVFLGCHLDMTSIRNVTSIDNVTDKCYVIAMSNVTHKCEECNEPMTGRVDRKYCSAACRQKAYRNSRNVTVTNNVTAEPFELNTKNAFYARPGFLWSDGNVYALAAANDEETIVDVYPPRSRATADKDLVDRLDKLRNDLGLYDQAIETIARMKATAEAILKFHEAP